MCMWKWWDTSKGAWGLLATGLGVGIVLTYISPQVGIPVGGIITSIGILLIVRAYRGKTKYGEKPLEQGELTSTKKRNVYNQRIRKLRQSLDELFYDARTKRPTETEYQTTEYQTRIKDCRKLATNTGNSMAIERTTAILNLIHLYIQRIQQARKEANADFSIEVIDSTFSERINTELGLLLNEVLNG